ncbi:MAG: ribosome rescue GTPase HflX [Arenicella sp.]
MFEPAPQHLNPKTLIVYQRDSTKNDDSALEEIRLLAESAGCQVFDCITSYKNSPDKATYVGSGKADEIRQYVAANDIELVIFNHTISSIQERNVERHIKCRVLDRTGLILDIFAQRARTHDGKLQVELAQLQHLSTRLVRGWTHLERQKGGIGLRGPGETQLETDRRLIGQRIKHLHQRLKKVSAQRELRRKSRKKVPVPTISLVGYTNAGKSSLFNALTNSSVYVEDQLFATLDTTMRRLELPDYGPIILSDTVGFIQDLPHSLVKAFHSTLEEVTNAQLLVHVVDSAALDKQQRIDEVDAVLREIEASDIPVITVFNKIDLYEAQAKRLSTEQGGERIWLSAHSGEGIPLLLKAIDEQLTLKHQYLNITLLPAAAKLRADLYERNVVQSETTLEDGSSAMQVRLSPAEYGWLQQQGDAVTFETTPN